MLPRAPEQTYIDRYPEEDQPAGPSFTDDRRHQSDYETEVKMYRASELGLDKNFIVLHSFIYTHDQYCLCAGKSHVRNRKTCNKCKNLFSKEGECDFIIICPDSFIVIEVKNMEHVDREMMECEPDFHLCSIGEDRQPECTTRKLEALIGTYRKSAEQRSKIVELIKCIDKDATILQFTAYPNFSKQFKEQFQFSELTEFRLSDNELSTIIFEEDLCRNKLDFSKKSSINSATSYFSRIVSCFSRCCNKTTDTDDTSSEEEVLSDSDNNQSNRELVKTDEDVSNFDAWWAENVTQAISSIRIVSEETVSNTEIPISGYNQNSHEKARNILLAIWATDNNKCDQSKCSLGRCIMDVNKQLKEGRITFEPKKGKKRYQNPAVVKAPDVIKNNSNVENLTVEQHNAFESKENLLLINGPAGAGKTVILCGKILQLLESDMNNKVVVFKFTGEGNNSQHYQNDTDLFLNASIESVEAVMTELKTFAQCSGCKANIDKTRCIPLGRARLNTTLLESLQKNGLAKTNCHFTQDVLNCYTEWKISSVNAALGSIDHCVWYNQAITDIGAKLWNNHLIDKGIFYISDFLSIDQSTILNYDMFINKWELSPNTISKTEYLQAFNEDHDV
ncbi:uncharacterized protein LOC134824508 [Bolinopsis microptera]|uniref:uncharacterized protein LOC134824508 n=1 Tax=Bolinopsis microptera TaxID=2820187 RepID=UPI00307A6502